MYPVLETVKKRYSVRTYDKLKVEGEKLKTISNYLDNNTKGPFGNQVRFKLVSASKDSENQLKKFVSYGNIKGANLFIAGVVKKGEKSMEDFGYCMEKNILLATSLGLGTVWLGGSLNRSDFASEMNASADEVIPAITPLGYAADKRSMMDKLIRTMSKGQSRKEFGQLFYSADFSTPLDQTACAGYEEVLEAVRLAPSASNKQPWRVVKEKEKNVFHFYMEEHISNKAFHDIKLQNNDMGIAMCHFELAAKELGQEGLWQVEKPALEAGRLVYIVSWKG